MALTDAVRDRVRTQFFRTLERAFDTDDGRAIAVGALDGLLEWRPRLPAAGLPAPYPDLGRAVPSRDYTGTVFISARFRTGSTLVWNLFRQLDGCVAYYEPLNERRWFDPARRGNRIDRTHRGVEEYWREYEGLADLIDVYREAWVDRQLVMGAGAWAPRLRRFFDRLITHAGAKRAILQDNRLDFRLPWLRAQFPGATLVHLYRHPRDQWCSTLMNPERVPRDITIGAFEPHDHFYLRRWARDLRRHFPFLASDDGTNAYRTFYFIWKLSYLFGAAYADHSMSFEALVTSPALQIDSLLAACAMPGDPQALATLVGDAPRQGWRAFAPDAWFEDHEAACDDVIEEFLRGQ